MSFCSCGEIVMPTDKCSHLKGRGELRAQELHHGRDVRPNKRIRQRLQHLPRSDCRWSD